MRRRLLSACVVFVLSVSWACGLDAVGERPLAVDPPDTGAIPDATPGRDVHVDTCDTTSSTCSGPLAEDGWSPVIVPLGGTTCPSDTQTIDLVSDPKPEEGACKCGDADIDTSPCTIAPNYKGNVGGECPNVPNPGTTYEISGPGCHKFNNQNNTPLALAASYTPINPDSPGSCTVATIPDESRIKATPRRICAPSEACAERTCLSEDTATTQICVVHDGRTACPAAFPTELAVAAASTTLSCSLCGCGLTGSCGNGFLRYYSDLGCTVETAHRVVDGTCHPLDGANKAPEAFRYEPTPAVNTVVTESIATAGLDPNTLKTICCR